MHKLLWTRTRLGYLPAVLLSCLALFSGSCGQDRNLSTAPLTNKSSIDQFLTADGRAVRPEVSVLGSTSSFAVLGGSTVTSTGLSVVNGDLGVSPGDAITGFGPGIVNGTIHAGDAVAAQAQSDLTTAYNLLAGLPCNTELTGQDLGGRTLAPGVYCFSTSAQLTGDLRLDGQGNSNAVFIFQIGSTLTTAANASVVLINGGRDCNVYWQVGSSATLGTGTVFVGSILAMSSITLTTGVSVSGRALARTGAVTMDANTISVGDCGPGVPGERCKLRVSGEGKIPVDGGSANFGFVVQQDRDGRVKGELQYFNYASNTKVRIRSFSSLLIVGNTATFTGTGTINRLPGTFTVTVTDNGKRGNDDRFAIDIEDGPTESATLRRGNIKIHKADCRRGDGHKDKDDDDDDDDDDLWSPAGGGGLFAVTDSR